MGTESTTTKISTKIWRQVIDKLNRKLDRACLRRDAFLERILDVELRYLEQELPLRNTDAARDFIAGRLDQLDRKLVSLSLRSDLVTRLDQICARQNIVRDALFNRLFFLLAASQQVIDRVYFPNVSERWRNDVYSERRHEGPFFQNIFYPLEQEVDPFWAIRQGLDLYGTEADLVDYHDPVSKETVRVTKIAEYGVLLPERVYTAVMDNQMFKNADLYGLNCYLSDWQIPGHAAELRFRKELDELLESL
jgi:hypothetical protein